MEKMFTNGYTEEKLGYAVDHCEKEVMLKNLKLNGLICSDDVKFIVGVNKEEGGAPILSPYIGEYVCVPDYVVSVVEGIKKVVLNTVYQGRMNLREGIVCLEIKREEKGSFIIEATCLKDGNVEKVGVAYKNLSVDSFDNAFTKFEELLEFAKVTEEVRVYPENHETFTFEPIKGKKGYRGYLHMCGFGTEMCWVFD